MNETDSGSAYALGVKFNASLRLVFSRRCVGAGGWRMLLDLTAQMNATLVDPLKTTIVQDHRCMTTWVLRKRS
jgi:hypothetical protein